MLAVIAAAALTMLPNPVLTPGALNPAVTQANIQQTVCAHGWTKTIRPKASFTNRLKAQQLAALGGAGVDPRSVEEDHLVSLELGGAPADPKNLWPEPWDGPWGAHRKDVLETFLKRQVCAGKMSLAEAQAEVRTDWVSAYLRHPELPAVAAPHP